MAIPPPLGPYPSGSAFSGVLPSTIGLPVAPFGLQVHAEDCVDQGASPRPAPESPRSPRRLNKSQEVYIQRVGDPSHFKPAPTSASLGRRRSVASGPTGGARARSEVVERGPWPRGLSACAVNACAVPEVLKLEKLGEEAEIFELCVGAERGRVLYRAVAGLLQGVLLGILLAALLVEIERPGSGGVASLRCFTLALTESCFTLNLLRAHDGYAHGLQGEDRDGSGSRRRAWELVAHAAVLAVMNAVGLLCCLLSEMLSDEVRASLLPVQVGFGLLALWPALLDLQKLGSTRLPTHVLQALLGPPLPPPQKWTTTRSPRGLVDRPRADR
ncbi:unnamed protein product [Durusdinium trenchii]|uniref:Uncharacterized protein n=1 Tax=Durusdinium trenchii TaxID=1381693 RepID=A0ABP0S488_9DINO